MVGMTYYEREGSEKMPESLRLPPLEPSDVPLHIPTYLQTQTSITNQDEEDFDLLWHDLPEMGDEMDFYLDGRESGLSLESLWTADMDRAASSLGSWGEDEFDQAAAKRVADMFAQIDSCVYDNKELPNNPGMSKECRDWANKFPHFRVAGKQLLPTEDRGYRLYPRPPSVTLSAPVRDGNTPREESGQLQLEVLGHTMEPRVTPRRAKKKEEIIAEHGIFEELIAFDQADSIADAGQNPQFSSQRNKIFSGLMDKLWPEVGKIILAVLHKNAQKSKMAVCERRHSEPVLPIMDLGKKLSTGRKSPDILHTPRKSKTDTLKLSPRKSLGTTGSPNSTKLSRITISAPARKNNSVVSDKSTNASNAKSGNHFSKLPPIDHPAYIPPPNHPRTRTSHSLQSMKMRQSRGGNSFLREEKDPVAQYNLSPRKAPQSQSFKRKKSELAGINKRVEVENSGSGRGSNVDLPNKPPSIFHKRQVPKKISPSKSASPRRKGK